MPLRVLLPVEGNRDPLPIARLHDEATNRRNRCAAQGIFLKRQKEVAVEMARMSKENYLKAEHMWEEILYGTKSDKFFELFETVTSRCCSMDTSRHLCSPEVISEKKLKAAGTSVVGLPV